MANFKTVSAKPDEVKRDWVLIDADSKVVGRVATKVATLLQGKHKPIYTKHVDTGDAVVIINAEKIAFTGNKEQTKMYHSHSGYPGGIKSMTAAKLREKHPTKILEAAIKRMLPKGPLGRQMFRKLKVYAGAEHPHAAQAPKVIEDI